MARKSFFRKTLEKNGILNESISIENGGIEYILKVEYLLGLIEKEDEKNRKEIRSAFILIDKRTGKLINFLRILAYGYANNNFEIKGNSN
ncbi:hypothetical protein [Bacillus massiliglaciei]|uniref:hypothetical protein n=1 Tax=Bacillus massiliglaciei TaxID=1816693 RepID=UPI000DA62E91|nr:hypothetical protein [Bacillus massiliglaciei]